MKKTKVVVPPEKLQIAICTEAACLTEIFNNCTVDQAVTNLYTALQSFEESSQKVFDRIPGDKIVLMEAQWAGYDGGYEVYFTAYRYETDKEYNARMEKNKKAAEQARRKRAAARAKKEAAALKVLRQTEESELRLLEELKKKYESAK